MTSSRNGFNISPSFVFDNSDVVACDSLLHMRNDYIQKKVDALAADTVVVVVLDFPATTV